LTNGRTFDIHHPEQAALQPSVLIVGLTGPSGDPQAADKREVTIALLHITHLETLLPGATPSTN
jgi:hypothetical protein